MEDLGEVISTDLLVIGGGLAGIAAAIKAKEYPVGVLVVDRATVLFLLSELARQITGHTLVVDGGQTLTAPIPELNWDGK